MRRILITGATGFIGISTILSLLNKNIEVHAIASKSKLDIPGLNFHTCDLLSQNDLSYILNKVKPDHILHTAWVTTHGDFWESELNYVWEKTTLALADIFFKNGGQRFIGLGTCAEYDWHYPLLSETNTPENPNSIYGKSKKNTYYQLKSLALKYDTQLAWARIFFPYGPRENPKRFIPYVINSLLKNEEALCTHGNQLRDFMYIDDVAAALTAIVISDVTGVINVGSGSAIHLKVLAHTIGSLLGKSQFLKLGAIADTNHSPPIINADISRLKNEVKWQPTISIEEGLIKTIRWWQDNHLTTLKRKIYVN